MRIGGLMKTTLLDYPGHVACTLFTDGCNFRCPFCHNSELLSGKSEPFMTEDEFFKFLEKRQHTLEGIAITGGEPTLQKDLPDFIRHIKGHFDLKVKLDTNGSDWRMVDELLCEGLVDYIAVDIKAGAANYSKLAGVRLDEDYFYSLTDVKEFLIRHHLIPYEFRTTVVGGLHTEQDFREIGQFIKGAKNYYLQAYKESDSVLCRNRGFYTPSKEELMSYRDIVSEFVENAELRGVD